MEGLLLPAWVVALAIAGLTGAKAVVMVRQSNGNGHGRASGVFEGRALALLETQTDEISELRNIAQQQKDILQQLVTLLATHDQRSVEAIARMDARAQERR